MGKANTKVKFWGGLRTIGGTIITIEYKNSRVIFDFGLIYQPGNSLLSSNIKERKNRRVHDYIKLGMLPEIQGIYRKEDIKELKGVKAPEKGDPKTAVLISHLHLDHMAAMGDIDESIPVYLSEDSLKLYNVLETIGEGVGVKRAFQGCPLNQTFAVGEIKITPIPLDHDVFGACGFHIETPEGTITYTGDIRLHGKFPEKTEAFIKEANRLQTDILISEGVSLRSPEELSEEELMAGLDLKEDSLSEAQVLNEVVKKLKGVKGIAIFNIYHRNLERIQAMLAAGEGCGRKVVLEFETAYIAYKLLRERGFLLYGDEQTRQQIKNQTLPKWKAEIITEFELVYPEDIRKKNNRYFLQNSYTNLLELLDLDLKGGMYIHSNGVPLGSFDPDFDKLTGFLESNGVVYSNIHCGGHAAPNHLKYIVDQINPKTLVPLHSFYPERLHPKDGEQLLPEYGEVYELHNGKLTKT